MLSKSLLFVSLLHYFSMTFTWAWQVAPLLGLAPKPLEQVWFLHVCFCVLKAWVEVLPILNHFCAFITIWSIGVKPLGFQHMTNVPGSVRHLWSVHTLAASPPDYIHLGNEHPWLDFAKHRCPMIYLGSCLFDWFPCIAIFVHVCVRLDFDFFPVMSTLFDQLSASVFLRRPEYDAGISSDAHCGHCPSLALHLCCVRCKKSPWES